MSTSTNLTLPFLQSGQAQKHVTVNESLLRLDALVQCVARSRTVAAQPSVPNDGDVYILPTGKSGASWAGMGDGALAYYRDGVWEEITPRDGWVAYVADEGAIAVHAGGAWSRIAPAASNRNALINGGFLIWQRGASFAAAGYCADRWRLDLSGSTASFARQDFALGQTDVPGEPKHFARVAATGGAGAGDYVVARQRIEGVRSLAGQHVTISFYARRNAGAGDIAVELAQSFGTGGSPSSSVTAIGPHIVTLGSSWARHSVSVDVPSIAGKTLGANGNDYLELNLWLSAGSTFAARAASLGAQTVTVDLASIQLEVSALATPFDARDPRTELAACQRYFEKSFLLEQTPAQNAGANTQEHTFAAITAGATTARSGRVPFGVRKRASAIVTFYNPEAANGQVRDQTNSADCSGSVVGTEACERGFIVACTGNAATTIGARLGFHWAADAEL